MNAITRSWRLSCAAALVAAVSFSGPSLAQDGKGKGPPNKGKNTIQIDLDKLPPGLARQVVEATLGRPELAPAPDPIVAAAKGKKGAEEAPSKGKKKAEAAPSKGKKAPAAAPAKGKKGAEAAPSKGKKKAEAAPSKGKKAPAAAPSKGKKPAASAPSKHGKGLALGHQIAPGLRIAPGLHKKGAAAPSKHAAAPAKHDKKAPAKHEKKAPSKGAKPEAAPAKPKGKGDTRADDLEKRLDRIARDLEELRREIRRR